MKNKKPMMNTTKKRVTILVTIALILAITAITLNVIDSEVSTTAKVNQPTGAVIGIEILATQIEDKLAETTP